MDRKFILPKAAVILMFLSCVMCFTIRKRSSQSPSELTKALKVLQRQRRRVDMSDYLRNNLDAMQESYDPYEEYGALDGRYSLDELLPAYQQYLEELDQDGEQEMPNGAPSLDELKSLFGTSEKGHNSVLDEAIKVKDDSHSPNRKITKSQMEKLLNQVKDEETQDAEESEQSETPVIEETGDKDSSEGAPKPEVVSKEELKNLFGGDESSEATDNSPSGSNDSDEEGNGSTGEEMVPQINSFPAEKKKKVAKRDNGETLRSEESDLHNEIALLHLMEGIEDQEIDNLASALKEATMSQMEGTDSYLRPEYKDIEKAIRNEEILQELKSNPSVALQIASLAQLAESNGLDPEEEEDIDDGNDDFVDKRSEIDSGVDDEKPTYEDGLGRWYEHPLKTDEDEIEEKDAQAVLERFVKQLLRQQVPIENQIDDVQEIERRNGESDRDESIRQALLQYLDSQQDDENQDIPDEMEEEMQFDVPKSCLAVDLLNTDCEIADKMGLPIDDEARELCNRHELCYSCGKGHGVTKNQCDQGFGSEVIEICGPNKSCIRDGAQFLWLIKSGQQYNGRPIDECRDPCVRDYILGL